MDWQKHEKPIIVGAGIAGLSSALALSEKGISNLVLESRDHLEEVGAGIQLAPNATRLLKKWGVLDRLIEVGVKTHFLELRDGLSAKTRMQVDLQDVSERRWHAPYITIHRADLQNVLYEKAKQNSLIDIRFDEKVIAVSKETPELAEVHTDHQGSEHGFVTPLIIGCDGVWSKLRQFPPLDDHASFSGYIAWRATIDVDALPKEFIRTFTDIKTVVAWMGPNNHLVAYPLKAGKSFNFVAITHGSNPGEIWSREGDKADLLKHFKDWHPAIRNIFNLIDKWTFWPLFQMLPQRFSDNGLRVFVGDASHGFLPFAAQGAAMAIEDSAALSELLADKDMYLSEAMSRYSNIRAPRVAAVNKRGLFNSFVYHATGPVAVARNLVMKMRSSESFMASLDWLYGYDAARAVHNLK
ncbi:FAD-binding protein [Bartonella sp. B10834G6]|uniref:FAD-binding protein n=1 Tax=Bartonella apis TaxID=1686310 RepID=UPI0018DDD2AF|nr:FAD-binding protein [Bartonella apis]MBH9982573.1 FAD-binding protein [Bartonella apis]